MKKDIKVPLMSPPMPAKERALPISQRENIRLAFAHKKPKWMPIICDATQWTFPPSEHDSAGGPTGQCSDGYDWFGTFYKYEAAQCGTTPMPGMFDEIDEWEEKVKWPDLEAVDWTEGFKDFVRDPGRALATRFGTSGFERLIAFEGFEQCLCDILTEPEECAAFFKRHAKYRADCIRHLQEVWHFDYIINHDDWANARSQFFSLKTFEETLLEPAASIAEAAHAAGTFYMAHCCGKMDAFVPYFTDVIHADALEIQSINDIRAMLDSCGSKLTPMFTVDPYFMYDPDTTPEQARAYAREIVDKYGAHTCDGSGVILHMHGDIPESYYAFTDEIYNYSGDKYASLSN